MVHSLGKIGKDRKNILLQTQSKREEKDNDNTIRVESTGKAMKKSAQGMQDLNAAEEWFYAEDGKVLKSLPDLLAFSKEMDESVFYHHVPPSGGRNDFALWVKDTFRQDRLASAIESARTPHEFRNVLARWAEEHFEGETFEEGSFDEEDGENVAVGHGPDADFPDCKPKIPILSKVTAFLRGRKERWKNGKEERLKKAQRLEKMRLESIKSKTEAGESSENETGEKTTGGITNSRLAADTGTGKFLPADLKASTFKGSDSLRPSESSGISDLKRALHPLQPSPETIKIGIPGVDGLLNEGIPKGSAVLLAGGPGTGKTTFGLCALGWACRAGQRCLYVSFEEDVERLRSHLAGFGFGVESFEKEDLLIIKKISSFELSRSVEALLAKASGELLIDLDQVEGVIPPGFNPDFIVVDSLSAVASAFWGKQEAYRVYLEQLFELFKKERATSFFISEVEHSTTKYSRSGVEEFLADAVVVFYNLRHKLLRVPAIEVVKVRGVLHNKKIVPFRIMKGKGMVIYPQEDLLSTL